MAQALSEMEKFSKLLEIVDKYNGTLQQGTARNIIWFKGKQHKERAEKAFNECKELRINVYYLSHNNGWQDEYNKVNPHSSFEYR